MRGRTALASPAADPRQWRAHAAAATYLALTGIVVWAAPDPGCSGKRETRVTATAYNSVPAQTHGDPRIAAWGDRLEPGMQVIAISRDLVRLGLTRGSRVCIAGLPGHWEVLDQMHHRWSRRIDLYMGEDVNAAREWGRRTVLLRWDPPTEADPSPADG